MENEKDLDFDYVGPDEWGTYPEPEDDGCKGCDGTCCTGVGSEPRTC